MSYNYGPIAETARRLIANFGKTVTISRTTTTVDPVTGASSSTTITGDFTVVNPPASGGTIQAFDNRIAGDAAPIFENIRFLIVAAVGAPFEPRGLDMCLMDGEDYQIAGVTPVKPAGVDLVYRLGMRKA